MARALNVILLISLIAIIDSVLTLPLINQENTFKVKRDLNAIHEKLKQTLNPQPILDTITEAEKCCNNVQHLIGKKFVDTYDQISKVITNAIQLPQQKMAMIGQGVTKVLDTIGGKLVGLY